MVAGTGYRFSAPEPWSVVRSGARLEVSKGKGSVELVSVSRFPLLREFRPELWAKVVGELDRAAAGVAQQQQGTVTASKTVTISGRRARRYDIDYTLGGKKLVERIAFVLRAKTEYLLLCRYEQGKSSDACDALLASFRLM